MEFYARLGGMVPFPEEILSEIQRITREPLSLDGDPVRKWFERFSTLHH
jgi:2-oxoglutarate ferredoxin oxidoreductase subunit alpha